uniref:NodB homology domain-containing protein n=1 Tax=viral metagenome TaxID=1070528 RepID=A0A6M3XKE2_9ZZZZ
MPAIKQKFFLSLHDFGFLLNGLDDIIRLKKIYKDFKITCFLIPMSKLFYIPENIKHFKVKKYKEWAKIINSYEWMEIGLHGFAHTYNEMDCSYPKATETIKATENFLNEIGLHYKKLFVAPYWQYSWDSLLVLKEKGYTVGIDRNHQRPIPEGLKTYIYNWSYEEELPKNKNIIKGHGHLGKGQFKNGLEQCYYNIINQISVNAKFGFVSELAQE